MARMKPVFNVHVIPVGLEIDRAALPLREYKADRVYLLAPEYGDSIDDYFLDAVKRELEKGVEVIVETYNRWDDFYGIMARFCDILKREQGNKVFVNISSGGKLPSIAGTLASLMFDATAYYVVPERYENRVREQSTRGFRKVIPLPEYRISPPREELIDALKIIDNYEVTSQKTLSKELLKKGLLRERDEKGKKLNEKALHVLFRRQFLRPLEDRGWIRREGQRRATKLSLTEEGENVLRIFGRRIS